MNLSLLIFGPLISYRLLKKKDSGMLFLRRQAFGLREDIFNLFTNRSSQIINPKACRYNRFNYSLKTVAPFPTSTMIHTGVTLDKDCEVDTTDVLVIGGGPAGLATAIKLKQLQEKSGKEVRVILLEKGSDIGKYSDVLDIFLLPCVI